jgi:hypothetical protein
MIDVKKKNIILVIAVILCVTAITVTVLVAFRKSKAPLIDEGLRQKIERAKKTITRKKSGKWRSR